MDKQTAMKKIQKCLALAASSEPHEAAAALRQAQKLMTQFGIDHPELLAAGVSEDWAKSAATKIPARYEVNLASIVADAFSCELLFGRKLNATATGFVGAYSFIGVAPSPEVAAYTYTVLNRQLKKARAVYIKIALKRHRKNKTAAADMFCLGWVQAVRNLIDVAVPTPEQTLAIDSYMRINHAKTTTLEPRNRELGNGGRALNHAGHGYAAGRRATVSRGLGNGGAHVDLLGSAT